MTSHQQGIERLRRLAGSADRRIRHGRALRLGARALCAALLVALVDVALHKAGIVTETPARVVLVIAGFGVLAVAITAWGWGLPPRAGARQLDRFYGLHDRLASALAFAEERERTPFMNAAIEDAVGAAAGVYARKAVPIPVPRALGGAIVLAALLTGVVLVKVRSHPPAATHVLPMDPVAMAADDLDDMRGFLDQLQERDKSSDLITAVHAFNTLVDDIAHQRLDRAEAFRRIEALEEQVFTGSDTDKKAFSEQLARIGDDMRAAELTKRSGDALSQGNLDQAGDALRDVAKRLRKSGASIDKAKLEQMREALKRAAADAARRQREMERNRQALADEVLKRRQSASDGGSDEETSLLEKKERELERLDRDLESMRSSGRRLDTLDREINQAAEDLMRDLGASADDLDRGAEDLDRMQQEQTTQQEKEQLRQRLEEMRQLLRQLGQGGQARIVRLERFGRMARGQGSDPRGGSQGAAGQDGPQGQQGGQGKGEQQGSGGAEGGQGGPGGKDGKGDEVWVTGPNGKAMLVLSRGLGAGRRGTGGSAAQVEVPGPARGAWGTGHDTHVQGARTNPKMGTEDTRVHGADTGQGTSRSQVILGAAQRGFASHNYQKVYTEYHQVAEEALGKDDIPGGYRFYVKRYFQLIRPRDSK